MTVEEFKTWFKGFNDALSGGVPTVEQYQTLKDAVNQIEASKSALRQWIEESNKNRSIPLGTAKPKAPNIMDC